MTDNDLRVLKAVERACGKWDGFGPHGASDWTAIRRLVASGLVEGAGGGECQTCDEPHEGPMYVLTDAGARELRRRA